MSQFPSAVRLNTTTMPGQDIINSPLQCILLATQQQAQPFEIDVFNAVLHTVYKYRMDIKTQTFIEGFFFLYLFHLLCISQQTFISYNKTQPHWRLRDSHSTLRLLILIQGCLVNLFILESSLFPQPSWPDIQCFTVQPVLEIPPRLKNKPVPDQIIKSVSRMLNSAWSFSDNLAIPFWL